MVVRAMVHSGQVQFTRDGRTLVVAEPDAVTLVEVRGNGRRRIAIPGVQAVAAFADQVWVATRTGALIRLALDGRRLDEHALPIDPDGVLIPTTIGSPAAQWAARESLMLVDDLGSLAIVPSHVEAGIPVAGRRFAQYAGSRVTLPAGRSTTLAPRYHITGGSVVLEGTSLALIAEHAGGRDVVVLSLTSGCILRTIGLPTGRVRFAAHRGLAVVHEAARRLAVIDLRLGGPLGAVVTDGDVTDAAVDPDGSLLAICLAGGELRIAAIGERMGAATRLSPHPSDLGSIPRARNGIRRSGNGPSLHPRSGTRREPGLRRWTPSRRRGTRAPYPSSRRAAR
jgi:hypothetical protein